MADSNSKASTSSQDQASSSAAPQFELTEGAAPEGGGVPMPPALGAPPAQQHQYHHEPRKRRLPDYNEEYQMQSCGVATVPQPSLCDSPRRRRRPSSFAGSSVDDADGDGNDSGSTRMVPDKKQNHSEIEKRRRDKMNTYIAELSVLVPMCGLMPRKLDKLTVLRLCVAHIRAVRGAEEGAPLAARPRPAYVTERELNRLVLAAGGDACLLAVGCDRGRLLYASASAVALLHYEKEELLGLSLFDILHPKDVAKVKEQLSASDLSPRERLIDAKTMLPVRGEVSNAAKRLCPGARRSFFCRIKCKMGGAPSGERYMPPKMRKKAHDKKYCVVQCTGYLKAWAPGEGSDCASGASAAGSGGEEEAGLSCLVAVVRPLSVITPPPTNAVATPLKPVPMRPLQFQSRHATDGKFLFVDQRVTLALGFLPQELLGSSLYELVSGAALAVVARAHKHALLQRAAVRTQPYAVRRKDGGVAMLQSHFKPFRNPWTKEMEYLVAQNTVVPDATPVANHSVYANLLRAEASGNDCDEVQQLIDAQVGAQQIGSAIAEEALRRSPPGSGLELPPELLHDAIFDSGVLVDPVLADDCHEVPSTELVPAVQGECPRTGAESPGSHESSLDGNSEAAMAVIMSLLEADAGLGGPVNFSGLPWPLP